jgi:hypothetical protein
MEGYEYIHDTTGSPVQVRIRIKEPHLITAPLYLCGSVTSETVIRTQELFRKSFPNDLRAVSLHQLPEWGQPVQIAARVNFTGMDTQKLSFYSYDTAANRYYGIETQYAIDENGYVHFTSPLAGNIVISDGLLAKKGEAIPGNAATNETDASAPESSSLPELNVEADNGFLPNPETGGDMIAHADNPPVRSNLSNQADGVPPVGGSSAGTLSVSGESGVSGTVFAISVGALFVWFILWVAIPRKNDVYVTVEEYRKRH